MSGTTLSVERKSNVSGVANESVAIGSWNVFPDYPIDITKGNFYEIRFQWLGVGAIEFRINGDLVHLMDCGNTYPGPYMRSGTQPLCVQITNTGTSTASSMNFICFSATSQGGEEAPLYPYAAQNAVGISTSTTEKVILAIRPKTTLNSVPNRILILPQTLDLEHTSGQLRWRLLIGSSTGLTITGGSWVSANSNSGIEYNITGTGFTGGSLITGGFIAVAPGAITRDLSLYFSRLGLNLRNSLYGGQDVLAVTAVKDSGGNTDVRATLGWGEIR